MPCSWLPPKALLLPELQCSLSLPPSLSLFFPSFIVKRGCCAWSSESLPSMAFSGSWWFIVTKDNHHYHHHLLKLYFWRLKTRRAVSFKIFKTKPQNTFGQEAYHPSLNQQANLASWNLLGLNYSHPSMGYSGNWQVYTKCNNFQWRSHISLGKIYNLTVSFPLFWKLPDLSC